MTISRRLALSSASAFALSGGAMQTALGATLKRNGAIQPAGRRPSRGGAQLVQQLLIHGDEARHGARTAVIAVDAPDTAWYVIESLNAGAYGRLNKQYKARGYRLRRVTQFQTKAGLRYGACWELASGPDWHSRHAMTVADFTAANADFAQRGFRLAHVDARVDHAAIWETGNGAAQQVFAGASLADYEQKFGTLTTQGYRPTRISATAVGGQPRFTALFETDAGTPWQAHHQMTDSDLRKAELAMRQQGYRMTDATGYVVKGKALFAAIWDQA